MHRCWNHRSFPMLKFLFGTSAFVHDMDIAVNIPTCSGVHRYHLYFTKCHKSPVNKILPGVEWRGSLAIFRVAKDGVGLVNVRSGETELIDAIVKAWVQHIFSLSKTYVILIQLHYAICEQEGSPSPTQTPHWALTTMSISLNCIVSHSTHSICVNVWFVLNYVIIWQSLRYFLNE